MSARPTAILFDLDGTLIDSAQSILAALRGAFETVGATPAMALTPSIIGPPLRLTLRALAGRDDPALIDSLAAAFRDAYDETGYRETEVYAGVPEMLSRLHSAGIALHIVTNKRVAPTRRILTYLGWTAWFQGVYALDALSPPAPHKPALVTTVLEREGLVRQTTWMVGDSGEDRRSAEGNALRFWAASWGYGAAAASPTDARDDVLRAPAELLERAGLAAEPHSMIGH